VDPRYQEDAMTPPETPQPESTYRLLLDAAGAWPDGIATQWIPDPADHTRCLDWTYAELARTVTRIANALTVLGVRRQDAVTLSSVNTSMLYAATLAAQAVGIAAPVNPALSSARIAELVRRTGSRVLVTAGPDLDPQLWQRLLEVARQAGMTAVLALRADGAHGDPPALGLTGDAPAAGTPNSRGPFVAYLDDVIAGQPADHLAGADPPKAGDLAAFVHTGGTTGAPKVAAHTHANQLACGRGIAESSGLTPGEAMLGGLPLFHVNALIVTGVAPMFGGARVVWPGPAGYRDKALYTRFWTIIEHYQIAAMSAVPTVYGTLAQVPVDADISTLRVPIAGASPLPATVREDFAAHTGRRLLEGYGLTEATCATTWTRPGEERPGSVGRVLPGQQIKAVTAVADGSWTDCRPGQTGVLVIGGPAVFAGYVTDPGLGGPRVSREGIVHDGWLDTGDLGMVDDRGFVYLTGRAKDLIIRGGHNIDPRVIEDALLRHPGVRGAAAVGRPDRHSGEVPVAYVVPAGPGRFDETDLLAWAAGAIDEAAARPKRIYPMTAIPVTEVGKPFKPALAADAAVRAITEALTAAGVADARVTAAHEDGRLVLTVTGADPGRVRDAVAGFALTVRSGRSPAEQTTNK
jgi:fatty-acyl-CoA synthase